MKRCVRYHQRDSVAKWHADKKARALDSARVRDTKGFAFFRIVGPLASK